MAAKRIGTKVVCKDCDSEGDFPDITMAVIAQREHLCYGAVASASNMGYEDYVETGEWPDV